MKLSIVILTWNSERFVFNCLSSIYQNTIIKDYEIIIVDNGSEDNTLSIIHSKFPQVKLITNSHNRGVAPARNQGIKYALGEYILILDIDTFINEYAIDKLIETLDNNPDIGICGAKLEYENGSVQNSCRRFPLLHEKILRRMDNRFSQKLLIQGNYIEEMDKQLTFEVDYLIGACQLIRKSALEQVGLLDENIFYGPEDVDICLRMWLKGWKVKYVSEATVIHFEQRITKKKVFSYITVKHAYGLLYYFLKYRYCFTRNKIYKRINKLKIFKISR